jgi:hypothetical protein
VGLALRHLDVFGVHEYAACRGWRHGAEHGSRRGSGIGLPVNGIVVFRDRDNAFEERMSRLSLSEAGCDAWIYVFRVRTRITGSFFLEAGRCDAGFSVFRIRA